jgi:hypothetical protein
VLVRYEVSERGSTLVFENTRASVVSSRVQLRAVSRADEGTKRKSVMKNKIAMTMAIMLFV